MKTTKMDSSRRASTIAILVLPVLALAGGMAAARAGDICQRTAADVQRACQAEAQSDYQLALGKCENIADPVARKACQDQAAADFKDALQTCREQFDARQAAC